MTLRSISACLLVMSSSWACTENFSVLDEAQPAPASTSCGECGNDELCAVDKCVSSFGVTTAAVGFRHACRVDYGRLFCWGANRAGQLGLGDSQARDTPTQVGEREDWIEVCAGEEHTCAVAEPGTLYCWGNNAFGQLGLGDNNPSDEPVEVRAITRVRRVACGGDATCALRDGRLYCWGSNKDLFSGGGGDVEDQPLFIGTPVEVLPDEHWKQLSLGAAHGCAIRTDGALYCWGQNSSGQLGLGNATAVAQPRQVGQSDEWRQVSAGEHHTCAVDESDALYCWGGNAERELGLGSSMRSRSEPSRVGEDSDWQSVSVGAAHSCAIKVQGGALYCWGSNDRGQLGSSGSGTSTGQPRAIQSDLRYRSVDAGKFHTCAIAAAQDQFCWGDNTEGQLGVGDTNLRTGPTLVQ